MRPPTIAHVHLGHALTGVHVTPGKSGYLIVAKQRAEAISELARAAAAATDLSQLKAQVAAAVQATLSEDHSVSSTRSCKRRITPPSPLRP